MEGEGNEEAGDLGIRAAGRSMRRAMRTRGGWRRGMRTMSTVDEDGMTLARNMDGMMSTRNGYSK